jgi:hypothetical protein
MYMYIYIYMYVYVNYYKVLFSSLWSKYHISSFTFTVSSNILVSFGARLINASNRSLAQEKFTQNMEEPDKLYYYLLVQFKVPHASIITR